MLNRINRTRVWVALTATILLLGAFFGASSAQADLSRDNLQRAMLSTVKILIIDGDMNVFGTCSGTHVGKGYIVTNWHCVGHTDLYGPDDTGLGLKNGETYHPDGWVAIAPQKDPRELPKPTYFARVVAGSPENDVAVVKIFRMIDESAQLPADLPMVAMSQDDSDKVQVDDSVSIIGYPGAGGDLITVTHGKISGFIDQTGDGEIDSFKTDAPINPGNSGGLAVDDAGNQIGIPTFGSQTDSGPGLGGIREINVAVPYIQQAMNVQDNSTPNPQPTPRRTATPSGDNTPGPTPSGNGPFGTIAFGTDVDNQGQISDEGDSFPSGTQQIVGVFNYDGMRNGMKWGYTWSLNGDVVIDHQNDKTWDSDASGAYSLSVNSSDGLPDGTYDLNLYVSNRAVQSGSFVVGSADSTPVPQPPHGSDSGVVIKGQIMDADTNRPVDGAVFVVLNAGVSVDDFDNATDVNSLVAAAGVADADGNFLTAPGLDRNQTYTVLVGAQGYQRREFADGLELNSDAPAVFELDQPIAIQQQ